MNTDKWVSSKSTQLSTKIWVKLLLLENALKLDFEATHTLTPPSINTQNRSKNYV